MKCEFERLEKLSPSIALGPASCNVSQEPHASSAGAKAGAIRVSMTLATVSASDFVKV
jgi:hypothetical protein